MKSIMMKNLMKSLFLLVFAGYSLGDVQKRVYVAPGNAHLGGTVAQGQGLHHVVVLFLSRILFSEKICGGSLISDIWVLTAAHCDGWSIRIAMNPTPSATQQRKYVEKHKCCSGSRHDLMLLKLDNNFGGQLTPIPLPPQTCAAPASGERISFFGWMNGNLTPATASPGITQRQDSYIDKSLRFALADVVRCPRVNIATPNWFQLVFGDALMPGHHLCVFQRGVSPSPGDSGGSLVWNGVLHGVLSFDCKIFNLFPAFFMDICNQVYRDWIFQKTTL